MNSRTNSSSADVSVRAPVDEPARVADLRARAQEAASLLKALANPDRLLLLCHLVECERAVAELGTASGIAQPTLSQQLAVLRGEGLVATRRDGKRVHYRIAAPAVHAVLRTLYALYCEDVVKPVH
jgi:DNA-binding transcriptional ArsR family regulator